MGFEIKYDYEGTEGRSDNLSLDKRELTVEI